jgi:hypothetical protein
MVVLLLEDEADVASAIRGSSAPVRVITGRS